MGVGTPFHSPRKSQGVKGMKGKEASEGPSSGASGHRAVIGSEGKELSGGEKTRGEWKCALSGARSPSERRFQPHGALDKVNYGDRTKTAARVWGGGDAEPGGLLGPRKCCV